MLREFAYEVVRRENIEVEKELTPGTSGAKVLLFRDKGERYVIKLPTHVNSSRAITATISAHAELERRGFSDLLPDFFQVRSYLGFPYVVMSYLGDDFQTCLEKSGNPKKLYDTLCERLLMIYARTRERDNEENSFVSMLERKIIQKYEILALTEKLVPSEVVGIVRDLAFFQRAHKTICFAPYSFTPEDIFLTDSGVVFPDLISKYMGLPEISLACLAGVVRDVRMLPDAKYGYQCFENLAKCAAHDIINYPHEFSLNSKITFVDMYPYYGTMTFKYGRALEAARSALFEVRNGNSDRAKRFAQNGVAYIRECQEIGDFT